MREVTVIAHNVRSSHNVGAILRTADGLGIRCVYLTGYTPYPLDKKDSRLPYLAKKIDCKINKTALGAEHFVNWQHSNSIEPVIEGLRQSGFQIIALEQQPKAVPLASFLPHHKVALIVGQEVDGIEPGVLTLCDNIVEIPMAGKKESLNVAVACGIALYRLTSIA